VKKVFYGLLGLLVLVVAAALIGPSFVDWNAHKGRLTAEVRKLTGQTLVIDGDVSLAVLPAPALSAENVRLANMAEGSAKDFIELRELRVRVALMPLLQGKVQLESVSLVAPTVVLEILPDGRKNWEFALAGARTPTGGSAAPSEPGGFAEQIQFDSFLIEEGTLIYRDGRIGQEERVERINAEIVAESLRGPFTARGDATARGVSAAFDLSLGRLVGEGAKPFKLGLRLPEPGARIELAGALSIQEDSLQVRGKLKSQGDDLGAVLSTLTQGAAPVPGAMLAQGYKLAAEMTGSPLELNIADLNLQLGDTSMAGEVTARWGKPLELSVALAAGQVDLDRALERAGRARGERAQVQSSSGAAPAAIPADWAVPEGIKGTIDLAVEAVVYRSQVVRQVRLNAELDQGRATIGQAFALLPGSSDISLTGTLANGEGGLGFDGRVEAASDNLRGLLTWLGADLSAMPADRLRRTDLSSRIDATPQSVNLSDIDLRVDLSRITGGVVIAHRARLGLGIGLAIDTVNLDAYLPNGGTGAAASGTDSGNGAPAPPPLETPRPIIESFDANLKLRVGNLATQGVTAKNLHLDGTLQDGALTVRQASVEDLAGTGGSFVGLVTELSTSPKVQGAVEIAVSDPGRLAKTTGLDVPAFERIGPFGLNGDLHGNLEDVNFSATVNALDGRFVLTGTAQAASSPAAFDLKVEATHDDLSGFANQLIGPGTLGAGLGALALKGHAIGTAAKFQVEDLAGTMGPIELSGTLSADLEGAGPVWNLNLKTGVLPIAALLPQRQDSAGAGKNGGGSAKQEVRWSNESLGFPDLSALHGGIKLASEALVHNRLRLDDARLEARVSGGVLDLASLTGRLYGGRLQVSGRLDGTQGTRVEAKIEALELNSAKLLQEHADFDRVSGPVSLTARLTSEGTSEAALISALKGSGDLRGTLELLAKTEEQVEDLLAKALGNKVTEIKGLADTGNLVLTAFSGAPSILTGSFTIEDGVIRTDDLRLEGRAAHGVTRTSVDLPRWWLDSDSQIFRAEDPATPYLTAVLQGQLDRPNTKVSGVPFQRQKKAPTEPEPTEPEPAEPEPTEPEPTEPEPEIPEPIAPEPKASEPETPEPKAAEPNIPESTVPEPIVSEPEATEPEASEPAALEADTAEASAPEAKADEPDPPQPQDPEPVEEEPKKIDPQTLIEGILERLGQ
jgi:uncharacterized protein involved in outer membrane biogenesis